MSNEYTKFESFKDFFLESLELTEEDISYDAELGRVETYPLIYIEPKDENEPVTISFNEDLPTSTIVNMAFDIIPFLEDLYETGVMIDVCHYVVFTKTGNFKEVLFEDNYEKVIKKVKEIKE